MKGEGTMIADVANVPSLVTARLRLAPTTALDAEDYFLARSPIDRDVARLRFLGRPPLADLEDARARMGGMAARFSEDPAALALTARLHDGQYVGLVGLVRWSRRDARSEMFWELDLAHEGRGYAAEAATAVAKLAFDALGVHRLEAHMDVEHRRSAAVAERIGMRLEARLRDYARNALDELRSVLVYSMFADERRNAAEGGPG